MALGNRWRGHATENSVLVTYGPKSAGNDAAGARRAVKTLVSKGVLKKIGARSTTIHNFYAIYCVLQCTRGRLTSELYTGLGTCISFLAFELNH